MGKVTVTYREMSPNTDETPGYEQKTFKERAEALRWMLWAEETGRFIIEDVDEENN